MMMAIDIDEKENVCYAISFNLDHGYDLRKIPLSCWNRHRERLRCRYYLHTMKKVHYILLAIMMLLFIHKIITKHCIDEIAVDGINKILYTTSPMDEKLYYIKTDELITGATL